LRCSPHRVLRPASLPLFFFNDPAPPEIYTLSLHDALPICLIGDGAGDGLADPPGRVGAELVAAAILVLVHGPHQACVPFLDQVRSEEHTSELQSLTNLVCRLLLEKKKHIHHNNVSCRTCTL